MHSTSAPPTASGRPVVRLLACVLLGVLVATVGTGIHRLNPPLGLVLAYLTVLAAAVLVRGWARGAGMTALGLAVLGTVLAMAYVRPGDDVIVVGDALGYVWLGGAAVVPLAALLPRSWFSDRQLGAVSPDRRP